MYYTLNSALHTALHCTLYTEHCTAHYTALYIEHCTGNCTALYTDYCSVELMAAVIATLTFTAAGKAFVSLRGSWWI